MAVVTFFSPENMTTAQTFSGTVTSATEAQIVISDGFDTAAYYGEFTYSGTDVFGILGAYQQFAGNAVVAEVFEINVDAHVAEGLIQSNDLEALFQLALSGPDTITGSPGNDVLAGFGGNDVIDGGGGHDAVLYRGVIGDYTITSLGNGALSVVDNVAGRDGTETLSHIDFLEFSDKTIIIADSDNANIARLYTAALGRAPDTGGLSAWEDIYANNISAATKAQGVYSSLAIVNDGHGTTIAGGFAQSVEFQNKYGPLNDTQYLTQLYENVLNRPPDPGGLDGWLGLMHGGGFTRDMVLVGFAESPENIAKTAADWLIQI